MRAKTTASNELVCPMPECGEKLLLLFEEGLDLSGDDMDSLRPLTPADAHFGAWKVECLNGHVLLVPSTSGCPCDPDDQGEPDVCPHNEDDYQWDEDGPMKFRTSDRTRLLDVLGQLGGLDPASLPGALPPTETGPEIGQAAA